MKFLFQTLLLTSLTTLWSCSHTPKKFENPQLTAEQVEQMNRDALAIASKRLEQMVIQAKTNTSSTNFLATDLFLKANMSLLEGDYVTSSVLFKHLVDLVPDDIFLQKKYAVSLIRVGDLEESEKVLEALYTKKNDDKIGLILAGVYTSTDKEDKARALYEQLLKANPKNEDACVFLSKSYALDKDTKKALVQLQSCAKNNPNNGMFDYYMGKIHLDDGKINEAIASFKKAHERQSNMSAAVSALGAIYEEREQPEAAVALYTKHLTRHPSDGAILNKIVQALFVEEKYEKVIPYAEKLSDLEPENLNLKVKLGILYTDAKRFPEAISVFKDLLLSAPQSDKILYYLGAIYQEMKDYQTSIEYFNQIQVSSGLYADSSIQMANMLSHLAQVEGANWKERFLSYVNQKLGELKDLQVELSVIKSGFFEGVGLYKEAMESMMVVQNEKNFSTQHKYYLANLFEKEKRFEESTALIMGILEKEPKNAHAWNFLGYALLVRGEQMEKAFEYIQTALKISPDDGYIRDSLGWYYYKKGDVKKALSELKFAFDKVPDDVEILKHLAEIHRELKDYSKARTYLESALKNARYQSDRLEILATIKELENARLPASGAVD